MRSGSPLIAFEALPGITLVEGGEPIRLKSGEAIGGVGVSGAPASEDGICARMAVDAIVEKLSK